MILFSFVFLTVVVTYVKVLHAARAASGSSQASARKARNTIALHGIQLLIYMLSFLSPIINIILIGMWPHKRTNILFTSFLFVNVLPRLLSPLIYGVRDQLFSSHVRLHLCSRCSAAGQKGAAAGGLHGPQLGPEGTVYLRIIRRFRNSKT